MKDRKPLNSVDRDLDRQLDDQFRRADDSHDTDSHIENAPRGAQIVQVETLGRQGMLVMLVMFIIIVGLAVLAGYALGAGVERDKSVDQKLGRMDNRIYVLEYDSKGLCGQLLAKKVVEVCH